VRPIVEAVAERGAEAALEFGESFDGVRPATVRVPSAALQTALDGLDPDVRDALRVMIERTRTVHADQRRTDVTTTLGPGATVTERWVPVERVGLYVPGGNAVYPSSVVMNVVPAQAAGVERIALATPPGPDGHVHPVTLAAAALCGIEEIYAIGGAQAVFALAYGTESITPVDVVAGPGNSWVQEAKRSVYGTVGIDSLAGPSELMVIAGHDTEPEWAALDLCAILLLALRIRQLTILARIDYGAPILAMQKTLAELRIDRIRTTMLTLVVAPLLWPPLLVVGFKALLGVDAYAAFGLPWLLANLAFGVLVILVARWIARRYAGRFDSSPLAQRLMRDLAGYNLSAAMDKLSSLAAFEA